MKTHIASLIVLAFFFGLCVQGSDSKSTKRKMRKRSSAEKRKEKNGDETPINKRAQLKAAKRETRKTREDHWLKNFRSEMPPESQDVPVDEKRVYKKLKKGSWLDYFKVPVSDIMKSGGDDSDACDEDANEESESSSRNNHRGAGFHSGHVGTNSPNPLKSR